MRLMRKQLGSTESGFSLIEAMVSLVVISVGMIGIAALYGQGLRAGGTALYRTQAVNLASDMADRIRANPLGDLAYNAPAANNSCDPGGGVNCTPAQMAANDLFVWQAQVANLLPGGQGTVRNAGGTPPSYTITVQWQEVGFGTMTHAITVQVPNF